MPADLDEVMSMKSRFDQWEAPVCVDCHTAASLLKLWLRELYEPLIPDQLYDRWVTLHHHVNTIRYTIHMYTCKKIFGFQPNILPDT